MIKFWEDSIKKNGQKSSKTDLPVFFLQVLLFAGSFLQLPCDACYDLFNT